MAGIPKTAAKTASRRAPKLPDRVEQGVMAPAGTEWEELGYGGPQVCKIAMKPISAPRCLESAAIVRSVSDVARNRMS